MILSKACLSLALGALILNGCAKESTFKGGAKVGAIDSADAKAPESVSAPVTVDAALLEESYVQSGKAGLADILIVVDDSASMRPYQNNLSSKLSALLVELKDADWQIAVITTNVSTVNGADVCNIKIIKSTDTDTEKKFSDAVNAGIAGSPSEQGMRQAKTGLACAENKWVRDNSTVAVLFVTDEEDMSYFPEWMEARKSDPKAVQADAMAPLISYVETDMARTVGVNAAFYGIFSPPSNPCTKGIDGAGKKYQPLFDYKSTAMGLNYGRICEESYKPTLELISKSIATLVTSVHVLKQLPAANSVVVTGIKKDGSALSASDYKVAGQVIVFNKGSEPKLDSPVKIAYSVTAAPNKAPTKASGK